MKNTYRVIVYEGNEIDYDQTWHSKAKAKKDFIGTAEYLGAEVSIDIESVLDKGGGVSVGFGTGCIQLHVDINQKG